MTNLKKLVRDFNFVLAANLISALRGLIFLPIIVKLLGVVDYGLWSQVTVTIALMVPAITLGLPNVLIRFLSGERDKKQISEIVFSMFFTILGFGLIFTIIVWLFSGILSEKFFEGRRLLVIITSLIVLVHSLATGIFLSVFQAFRQVAHYSIFNLLQSLGEIILGIGAITMGYGLYGAVLSMLIVRVVILCATFIILLPKIGFVWPVFVRIKEFLYYSFPIFLNNIAAWIVYSSDRYLISWFIDTRAVGIYSASYAIISGIIPFFVSAWSFVISPPLYRLYDEGDLYKVKRHISLSLNYFLIFSIPFVFGSYALGKQVLEIFSSTYIANQTTFITPVIAISTLFLGVSVIVSQVPLLMKKTKCIAYMWIWGAVVNIVGNVTLIPVFGINGAAVATLMSFGVIMVIALLYALREMNITIPWINTVKSILCSIFMTAVLYIISPSGLWPTLFSVLCGIIVYIILLILVGGIKKNELTLMKIILTPKFGQTNGK